MVWERGFQSLAGDLDGGTGLLALQEPLCRLGGVGLGL